MLTIHVRLDIVSGENSTIFKDDLLSKAAFLSKLHNSRLQYGNNIKVLTGEQVNMVRSLFEMCYKTKDEIKHIYELKKAYSIVIYVSENIENRTDELINKLISLWKDGTKIYFISDNNIIIDNLLESVKSNLDYLEKYKDFKIEDNTKSIFNLSTYFYEGKLIEGSFEVIDGEYSEFEKELNEIDSKTSFNFNQFKLEHCKTNEDIIVKAGAGSGKTYSMISRITYLIYMHGYTAEEITKRIYMITFTNEAADNMKERLKGYFMNYYLLTKKTEVFNIIESINKMQISTIHSLCKVIIDRFSSELKLGINSKIIQGTIQKNKIIEKNIDEYIDNYHNGDNILNLLNFRTFILTDRISALLEKIEQKNIFLDDKCNFGDDRNEFNKMIKTILPKIQEDIYNEAIDNNSIRLSQMIIAIQKLLKNTAKFKDEDLQIDYLFVDEFQDTDDVQIEIMRKFQTIYGYKFFAVGDIKQCIYRFRGADDDAFNKLSQGLIVKEQNLIKNYRTDSKLLNVFDSIFSKWTGFKYGKADALKGTKNINDGSVNILENICFNDENQFEEKLVETLLSEQKRLTEQYYSENTDKKKTYTIAILVRKNSEIEEIRKICEDNQIPIEADAAGNLYDLECARDLYALVLALKNHNDPKCLYNLFETNYTNIYVDKSYMFKIKGDTAKLIEYYNQLNPINEWNEYIKKLIKTPVMSVLREIIFNVTMPWEIYALKFPSEEREKKAIYYKRNLELILENIIRGYNNEYLTINKLADILRTNIYTKVKSNKREEFVTVKNRAVNIICKTVHRSKGLEYDVVVLPYCNKNSKEKRAKGKAEIIVKNIIQKVGNGEEEIIINNIGYSILKDNPYNKKEEEWCRIENKYFSCERNNEINDKFGEEMRVLYVALTRAISKVIYFSSNTPRKKDEIRWQDLINLKKGGER